MCYNMTYIIFYPHTDWYWQQNVLKFMKFIDVIHFIKNGFKLGIYSLKMTLLSRNMSE